MDSKTEAKQNILELVRFYNENKDKFLKQLETDTRIKFIDKMFEALGWDVSGRRIVDEVQREESVKDKESKKKKADYIFRINGVTRLVVEAKSLGESLDNPTYISQAIEYAYNKACAWAVLTNFREVRIFYVGKKDRTSFYVINLENIKNFETEFETLWFLSKGSFGNNELEKEAKKRGIRKEKISIDEQLYNDLKRWREILSNDIKKRYQNEYEPYVIDEIVQRIIDRLIFIRKTEDAELEERILEELTRRFNKSTYEELKKIFSEYNEKYNSKLFGASKSDMHECDKIEVSNSVIEEVIRGMYNPKGIDVEYNFAAIDADVLGNIYEQYLAYILTKTPKKTKLEGGRAHRKEQGIYYTPTYIVDYIVRNTLGELLKNKKVDVDKIRILDPACGSGSFLIKAFDVLDEHYRKNGDYSQTTLDAKSTTTFKTKERILKNNIFGVDLDEKAVEIAQLNLLLKIAERGHRLPLLQENIKCGNSLIDDPVIAGDKAFKWEEKFKEIMKDDGFDVVIGNPPYLLMQPQNTPKQLLDYVKDKFKVAQYKIDTYHLFFERAISVLRNGCYFGFITPNTYLMNIYISNLRKYILDNCKILKIIIIPEEVFPDASVDTAITILQKEYDEKKRRNNKVEILKIKDFSHEAYKTTTILQNNFFEAKNYIFNIHVSGGGNNIIKNLTKNTILLGEISRISFGLQTKDKKTYVNKRRINKNWEPCIDGGDISRYNLKFNSQYFLHDIKIKAGGCWDENTHNVPEKIVIRQIGVTPIATLDTNRFYCLNTIYNITSLNDGFNYRYILALINSKLIKFFWKANFYDSKLLFPKIKKAYLDQVPIRRIQLNKQQPLIKLVDKMLSLNNRLNEIGDKKTDERARIEEEINKTDTEIDQKVYELYGLTQEEIKIVEESLK